ncbi:MAG: hypothetical protein FWE57_04270 [Chitinispirillia bacterium]|nr:hypothetical protein [Chitinispirillia bacterium]
MEKNVTKKEDLCVVRVADSNGLWFCIEDLCKWFGDEFINGRIESLNLPDSLIKHLGAQTEGGWCERLYLYQKALYMVLCDSPDIQIGDSEFGQNCFCELILAASDHCYSIGKGTPAYVPGLAELTKGLRKDQYLKALLTDTKIGDGIVRPSEYVLVKDVAKFFGMSEKDFIAEYEFPEQIIHSKRGGMILRKHVPLSVNRRGTENGQAKN